MRAKSLDLFAVIVLAIAVVPGVMLTDGPLRVLLGLPLVLLLPGYAATAVAFPSALGAAERTLLSLGLSLALAALGGVVLGTVPGGLQAASWAVLLAGTTLVSAIAALLRRGRASAGLAGAPSGNGPGFLIVGLRQGALFLLAALVLAAAIASSRAGAARQHPAAVTQLWMLPSEDGDQPAVRLGVTDYGEIPSRYTLEVRDGKNVVTNWSVVVGPGRTWQTTVALGEGGAEAPIEAVLYRSDEPQTPYRRVALQQGRDRSESR